MPADGSGKKIYKITREKIALTDSEAQGKVFDIGKKPDGRPYRIGVIDLPSFYRDTDAEHRHNPAFKSATHDVRVILDKFRSEGVDAVILDLRTNGGGALNEAISLTSLFINDGKVVQVKDAYGQVHPYEDEDSTVAWSGPLVVLISKFSASASEILAGAIQDYHRGLIVGDHSTHGKGTVQSLLDLGQMWFRMPNVPPMGALKITMQQFYRPDGDSTQRRGVLADVELPSITTYLDVGEADLDYPLPFDKVDPTDYKRFDDVNPTLCEQLRRLSEQRVKNSEKFQKVVRNIARYKEQKAKKYITLNEAKFLKERSELNADREEEKAIDLLLDSGVKRDYYLDEAMAITADYLNLEQLAKSPAPIVGSQPAVTGTVPIFVSGGCSNFRLSENGTVPFVGWGGNGTAPFWCDVWLDVAASGSSSVGRASASQAECRGFEPLLPLWNRKGTEEVVGEEFSNAEDLSRQPPPSPCRARPSQRHHLRPKRLYPDRFIRLVAASRRSLDFR